MPHCLTTQVHHISPQAGKLTLQHDLTPLAPTPTRSQPTRKGPGALARPPLATITGAEQLSLARGTLVVVEIVGRGFFVSLPLERGSSFDRFNVRAVSFPIIPQRAVRASQRRSAETNSWGADHLPRSSGARCTQDASSPDSRDEGVVGNAFGVMLRPGALGHPSPGAGDIYGVLG